MRMNASFDHPTAGTVGTTGVPWWFSESETQVGVPPLLGQHTGEVLRMLGREDAAIARLVQSGDVLVR